MGKHRTGLLTLLVVGLVLAWAAVAGADTDSPVKRSAVSNEQTLSEQLRRAWLAVERGHASREAAVLIVAGEQGGWRAVPVLDQAGFQSIRLEIPPRTVAILHTHPNSTSGEPSPADRRNSDLLGIPNFTLTDRGVWRYDPRTRRSERVMYKLSWLEHGSWEGFLSAAGGQWQ